MPKPLCLCGLQAPGEAISAFVATPGFLKFVY